MVYKEKVSTHDKNVKEHELRTSSNIRLLEFRVGKDCFPKCEDIYEMNVIEL